MSSERRRILFVDDEPRVMYGLRYMLHTMNKEWDMEFVTGSAKALDAMEKQPFELIVADMLMPEMYGGDLLEEIRVRYPGTVRFILSGYSNKEMIIRSFGATHQYLAKPCNADILKGMVAQVLYLHGLLPEKALRTSILDLKTLATHKENRKRLLRAVSADEVSTEEISAIIRADVAMTAVILHFVNSAFFGLRHKIENIEHAVATLGIETIRDMFLEGDVLDAFSDEDTREFDIAALHERSVAIGARAGRIMKHMGQEGKPVSDAVMAGMLHGVGRIALPLCSRDPYAEVVGKQREGNIPPAEAERAVLGASYAEAGGYLLGLWGLPDEMWEAVYYHLRPGDCPNATISPLTAVHAAVCIEAEKTLGADHTACPTLDSEYLDRLGVGDMAAEWRND